MDAMPAIVLVAVMFVHTMWSVHGPFIKYVAAASARSASWCWYRGTKEKEEDSEVVAIRPAPRILVIYVPYACSHGTTTTRGTNKSFIRRACTICGHILERTRRPPPQNFPGILAILDDDSSSD